jgi:hypothetical protein
MPGRAIALVVVVLLLGIARPASALEVFWTTNPDSADHDPALGKWRRLPYPTSLSPNEPDIWLGFKNVADPGRRKFLRVRFHLSPGDYFSTGYDPPYPEGFATSDTTQPLQVYGNAGGGINNNENYDLNWSYDGQPKWERLRIARANGGPASGLNWFPLPEANSMCTDAEWVDPIFSLDNSSLDAPGATGTDEGSGGTPHYHEIWIFPFGPWGPRIRIGGYWSFVAPPSTGSWTASYVYTDPNGNPRPDGGIKFTCTGSGLTTADQFNAQVEMMNGGPGYLYEVYAYNQDNGQYRRNIVRAGILGLPGVSPSVLVLIAISTIAAGALFLQRPRVA